MTSIREQVRDAVREFLGAQQTVTAQPMRTAPKPEPHTRRAAFEALTSLRARQLALDPLRAEAAGLTKELEENEARGAVIRQQLGDVEGENFVKNLNISTAIDRQLAIVRQTASPMIDQLVVDMGVEIDRLLIQKVEVEEQLGERNYDREVPTRPKTTFSTQPSITRRVGAIRKAIQRAGELKFIDLSEEGLAGELAALRDALPAIEAPEKVRV